MLTITLDSHSTSPMYEQIYEYIKNEIKNGNLPHQTKLPSTRSLASHIQVSRNTVDMAYSQLLSEGYIESRPKSGYYVSLISNLAHIPVNITQLTQDISKDRKSFLYDFSPFAIDINNFPYNIWRKLSKDCMNENNNEIFLLGDNQGDESLRSAIATYLHQSRNVNCTINQIIIGAGADYLLQLLSQILQFIKKEEHPSSNPSCTSIIAMENPTYKQAYRIFQGMHYKVLPIDLDQEGISIRQLQKSSANIAYVTPSHQYPLGIVMPIKRRLELLQWANQSSNRFIIEDDHDSEFRYKGKPIPSLQGIDTSDKVIYIGTFSRAVAPAIRIGYMVLPKSLLELYKKHLYHYSSTVSRVDQYIMSKFINEGHFERHLNKMRKIYKNKHDKLIQALRIFGNKISIEGENAGLHLVLHFHSNLSEQEIINTALDKDIKLYGLTKHYIESDNLQSIIESSATILLGYANVNDELLDLGIQTLYHALNDLL